MCRADEREQQRGLSAELAARWSSVTQKAKQRWRWPASAYYTGQVFA
jgi:hypothetical protein